MDRGENDVTFRALRPPKDPTSFYKRRDPEARILARGTSFGPARPAPLGSRWHGGTRPLPADIWFESDIAVTTRGGDIMYVDVFRPPGLDDVPAIVAWSPYGKQGGYWNYCPGNLGAVPPLDRVSGLQKFEGPDPAEWVSHGYAVIHPDPPGAFGSTGKLRTWGEAEGRHAYDLIEWTASQEWSNGRVGMAGNSWLGISQWFAAAEQPPHLAAIAPWSGFFDVYDFVAPGGVPAPGFAELITDFQWGTRMEWLPAMLKKYPLKNPYWDAHDAALEKIQVPAYVSHALALGVHRWTPEAFRRLASPNKWLRLSNTHEWYDLYTPEYVADLKRFFDRYLRDIDNGWEETPRVRITVLDPGLSSAEGANPEAAESKGYVPAVVLDRGEDEWPLARTNYTQLYLNAERSLTAKPALAAGTVQYRALFGSVSFAHTFEEDTELTGYPSARLWIELPGANDADLFVDLCKLDAGGRRLGLVETASIRVSHRGLDPDRSTNFLPIHHHRREERVGAGQIIPVDIAFAPISMLFRHGEQLRLRVAGTPLRWSRDFTGGSVGHVGAPVLYPAPTRNKGKHVVHFGAGRNSFLQIPLVPSPVVAG